jgi:hypothetical protein
MLGGSCHDGVIARKCNLGTKEGDVNWLHARVVGGSVM